MNRDNEADHFESNLRSDLYSLARQAPAGPSADRVLKVLHERALRRRNFAIGSSFAAAAAVVLVLVLHRGDVPDGGRSIQPVAVRMNVQSTGTAMARGEAKQPATGTIASTAPPVRTTWTSHGLAEPAAWSSFAGALSLAQASTTDEQPIHSGEASRDEWNLSLTLSLASALTDDPALRVMQLGGTE